jgi:hypothetical protein
MIKNKINNILLPVISGNFLAILSNKGLVELKTLTEIFIVGTVWAGMMVEGSSLEKYKKTNPFWGKVIVSCITASPQL